MIEQGRATVGVRVFASAPVIDFVMTGWDENGGQYETVVCGHRVFSKMLDAQPQASPGVPLVLDIHDRRYEVAGVPGWSEADGCWTLRVTLVCGDNQALHDCLADASWSEVEAVGASTPDGPS